MPPKKPAIPLVLIDAQSVVELGERPDLGQVVRRSTRWRSRDCPPTAMAPEPFTKPAHGVIPTRPQIIPFARARKVALLLRQPGVHADPHEHAHGRGQVRVHDPPDGVSPGAYTGSPPLKPFQPSHRMPGTDGRHDQVVGQRISSISRRLGPSTQAAAEADTPANMWMTSPPEKSSAPSSAKYPPPHRKESVHPVRTNVDHSGTSRHQALELIRPSTLPRNSSGVMDGGDATGSTPTSSSGSGTAPAVLAADTA